MCKATLPVLPTDKKDRKDQLLISASCPWEGLANQRDCKAEVLCTGVLYPSVLPTTLHVSWRNTVPFLRANLWFAKDTKLLHLFAYPLQLLAYPVLQSFYIFLQSLCKARANLRFAKDKLCNRKDKKGVKRCKHLPVFFFRQEANPRKKTRRKGTPLKWTSSCNASSCKAELCTKGTNKISF